MKITKISHKTITIEPIVSFKIASSDDTRTDTVIVKVETDAGVTGYGESQPSKVVTGNNIEDVTNFLTEMDNTLKGENPLNIGRIHEIMNRQYKGKTAGKAGIDLALYDILGKHTGLPVYQLLGGSSNQVESDMTIGIDEPKEMAKLARQYVDEGFNILKIKVGLNAKDDIEAIRLIREEVGPDISLRVDANQGYYKKQAVHVLNEFYKYGVEEVEQPVPYWDYEGMKFIKDNVTQQIMMDESVLSPQDAFRAIKEEACDIINIKLMKSGGIYPALQINAIAQAAGLQCMVGCMSESRIGIAAGAALAASQKNITYADLDSYRMSKEVPGIKSDFTQEGGIMTLSEKPGLGLDIGLEF
ncbi:dipeptide epimerase [Alkalibacterium sp. s-m-22]